MTGGPFIEPGRRLRARNRRRRARRRLVVLLAGLLLIAAAGVTAMTAGDEPRRQTARSTPPPRTEAPVPVPAPGPGQTALGPIPLEVDLDDPDDRVRIPFKKPPKGGLLVNLDTGEVLWRRNPERSRPIASLTKMMTALVAVEELGGQDKARITKAVLAYSGSGVGVLPKGKRVRVQTLLYGLMLPSGNDAARALAFRAAGSLDRYVDRMNAKAGAMGLKCTEFASVEGLSERNRSCPRDLAVIARKLLDTPRLARIVKRRRAILPFPIKGGRIHLYNNNPLLRQGYPGIIGVKTGYTDAAGRCLVAAARRNGVRLAAIVLDSEDPGRQARQLLDRGFRAMRTT